MWLTCQDRIQSGETLEKMNWRGDASSVVCGSLERADHILFGCITAKFIWACMKKALGGEGVE